MEHFLHLHKKKEMVEFPWLIWRKSDRQKRFSNTTGNSFGLQNDDHSYLPHLPGHKETSGIVFAVVWAGKKKEKLQK